MSIPNLTNITCHAWNADRTQIALCPNSSEIYVYKVKDQKKPSTWEKLHTLTEHDQIVTALDWAPKTNRLLSASQDRNAYVWELEEDKWKPTLVLLRLNRAATCCKWSPEENKFAVGSGAKVVSVCYFEADNNWWVSKLLKKHKSTVLAIDWCPTNNTILATACSDFKCRVFSAFLKQVDDKKQKEGKFNEELAVFPCGGWVHDVAWAPNGEYLAFVCHDSSVHFVNRGDDNAEMVVKCNDLPFMTVRFITDNVAVCGGHSFNPIMFSLGDNGWERRGECDEEKAVKKSATGVRSAFQRFQNQASTGKTSSTEAVKTKHKNTITQITILNDKTFASSGLDGQVNVWDTMKCAERLEVTL